MTDGRRHERIARLLVLATGIVVIVLANGLGTRELALAFLVGGWLGVYLVTPDNELMSRP